MGVRFGSPAAKCMPHSLARRGFSRSLPALLYTPAYRINHAVFFMCVLAGPCG